MALIEQEGAGQKYSVDRESKELVEEGRLMSVVETELAFQTSCPVSLTEKGSQENIPNMRARCKSDSSPHARSSTTKVDGVYLKFPGHIRSRVNKSVLLYILVGSTETWDWECFQYRFTGFLSSAPTLLLSWMHNSCPMSDDQENVEEGRDIQQYA